MVWGMLSPKQKAQAIQQRITAPPFLVEKALGFERGHAGLRRAWEADRRERRFEPPLRQAGCIWKTPQ